MRTCCTVHVCVEVRPQQAKDSTIDIIVIADNVFTRYPRRRTGGEREHATCGIFNVAKSGKTNSLIEPFRGMVRLSIAQSIVPNNTTTNNNTTRNQPGHSLSRTYRRPAPFRRYVVPRARRVASYAKPGLSWDDSVSPPVFPEA